MVKREDVQAVIDGILSGKILEAFESYYHDDVVMSENGAQERVGKDANREYEEQFGADETARPIREGVPRSHAFRLASVIAAGVISFATAAAADSADLDQRLQTRLDQLLEAKLAPLVEAKLDAQTAILFTRDQTRLDGLVETKLNKLLEAKLGAQAASLLARNHRPAAGDEIPAIADAAHLATRMTYAVGGSGTLDCVAAPVCGSDEVERPTVVASRPPLSSNPTIGC